MPSSSARDARTVIAVEKLLQAGCVLYSARLNTAFQVQITPPLLTVEALGNGCGGGVTVNSNIYIGYGKTFSAAFQDAYQQLPEDLAAA